MNREVNVIAAICLSMSLLSACTYNPFISNNQLTGSAVGTATGAAAGAGSVALLGGSKTFMLLGGLGGGALGYYVTTLRYESAGVVHAGGQVYRVGQKIGIYIPTDKLFEPNTANFLPRAQRILDSATTVLQRYPDNNIVISGNTSGFARPRWEQKLSQQRAQKVAAYLWNNGINQLREDGMYASRKLDYVGYGDYFPIANDITNEGIRDNSRMQIVSYPSNCDLGLGKRAIALRNVGKMDDSDIGDAPICKPTPDNDCAGI